MTCSANPRSFRPHLPLSVQVASDIVHSRPSGTEQPAVSNSTRGDADKAERAKVLRAVFLPTAKRSPTSCLCLPTDKQFPRKDDIALTVYQWRLGFHLPLLIMGQRSMITSFSSLYLCVLRSLNLTMVRPQPQGHTEEPSARGFK